ncbi:hypothetical protein AI3045V2_4781 (plasmid) [Enterobacter cloacae]|nr:hypothetical protein SK56_04623 [Enterobacter sp. MGH128]CAF9617847.1 hypothetical protein AI3045V2_4781 [Enterobacter cloacae]CAH6241629.1 hypothetical protein AI3045V2_4781 [Enterobacter cloacae]
MMSRGEPVASCLLALCMFALYHRFSIVRDVSSFQCDAGQGKRRKMLAFYSFAR